MLYTPILISVLEGIIITLPVLLSVAFVTVAERKTMASMQRRLGPNIVGFYGLLQAFADALKLLLKEYVSPTQANLILFFIGPIITLIFSLLGYAVIPFAPGLSIFDFNLSILFMLAVSSLATYGILLAGWSANSKYAFLGSKWTNKDMNLYLIFYKKIATNYMREIYWNVISKFIRYSMYNTLQVTFNFIIFLGSRVKILLNVNNPQVTKAYNSLVGTSEAICSLSKFVHKRQIIILQPIFKYLNIRCYKINHYKYSSENSKNWCQWLAGLIDGDGTFYLSKTGYGSLEITIDMRDEHALQVIKNVYGGSIKLVSGRKRLRYSLRHKEGLLWLIKNVNGEIRNSYRLIQLNKLCIKYDIIMIYPNKLTYNNAWLSGFFDADGSITLNGINGQLAITLTQKTNEILQPLPELYNGSIYIDKINNSFKWYIYEKQGILKLNEYFKNYPPRSLKKNRVLMINRCYYLKDMSAHKSSDTHLAKAWSIFLDKWNKYEQI